MAVVYPLLELKLDIISYIFDTNHAQIEKKWNFNFRFHIFI